MITEDYVSFGTAKLLKEKGFDGECRDYYNAEGHFYSEDFKSNWNHADGAITIFSAPTLQMAIKWLREIHKIGVFPSTYINIMGSNTTHVYGTAIVNLNTYEIVTSDCMARDTYNEACEAAIKYCLENLI